MKCNQIRIPSAISWVFSSIVVLGAISALPAWAACTEISTGVYECTGDFSDQQITLPGDIPDSATTITFTDLTADIGPITIGGQTSVIQLLYEAAATADAVSLTLDSDSNALISNGFAGGLTVWSFSGGVTGSEAGADGRDITFASNVDISAAFQSGDGGSTFGASFIAAAGGGSMPGSVSGSVGTTGGAGGTGGTINISGSGTIEAISGTGEVFQGVNAFSPGGTGGTGGTSSDRDGGNGGAGGDGGDINLAADGTWTINVGGVLGASANQAAVFATSTGGAGGFGGSGGDNNGVAGAGGAGGDITFTDGAGDAWEITAEGLPGVFLLSLGDAAGGTGHSTAAASGDGGRITKDSGSTMTITTSGNQAIGFLAISRGGDGVETSGNYNAPGAGGEVMIGDSWDIQTNGTTAHGIAAFSVAGDLPANADSVSGSGGSVNIGTLGGTIVTQGDQSFGILAQSIAGHDGSGGTNESPAIEFGVSSGTASGDGDQVEVANATAITTSGQESAGIGAQATGGGGGSYGDSFEAFFSGDAETAGGAGGTVIVDNRAAITTQNAGSDGIIAQSIGGAGGVGSSATSGSSVGSQPTKDGSDGGTVRVQNSGVINAGDLSDPDSSDACGGGCSIGIMAQSIGGGGGKGHTSSGAFSATGGKGGNGGDGGATTIVNLNTINTHLDHSAAIEAQSIGGGGGQGGGAVSGGTDFSHAVGGQGGDGGQGGSVLVQQTNASSTTLGDNADGIHAQSVGGGGGRGGYAISGTVQGASLAVGGKGGSGGDGGSVNVCLDQTDGSLNAQCQTLTPVNTAATEIVTSGDNSKGVFAHSVGGGGGNGGFSVAASASIGLSEAFSIGGTGGDGGDAGAVSIDGSFASVQTSGDEAGGVAAISAGGGGGNGGLSVAGTVTIAADDAGAGFGVSIGGNGGDGGAGAAVALDLNGAVTTAGERSSGILAQSIGGGGGNGGASVAGSISSPSSTSVNLSVGGQGGSGNHSGNVTVTYGNTGGAGISTSGQSSHGIAAQSIAGGGGHGGLSVAGSISFSESTSIDMAIGGKGGQGGNAGAVSVTNSGTIATSNFESHGILAQSSGGGGGYGGMSLAGSVTSSKSQSLSLSVAGEGGDGAAGNTVGVTNNSAITVTGEQSKGIIAQSIGGAGGYGGMAVTGTMATSDDSKTANVSVGGSGGKGGSAAAVTVTNNAAIITGSGTSDGTSLYQGYGILAQSVSGDGGYGGMAVTAQTNQGQKSAELAIGGSGGGTNAADTVTVNSNAAITTNDDNSDAILAQSIGGNGGAGGMTVNAAYIDSDTSTNAYSVSIGGGGGSGAQSKEVKVIHSAGAIQTAGENSGGVVAQSIGGGGGDGGSNISYNTSITTGSKTSASKVSVNVGGAGDNGSAAGTIFVQVTGGSISTGTNGPSDQDDSSRHTSGHGIFALSQGGGGGSGGIGMIGSVDTSDGDNGGSVTVGGNGGSGAAANNVTVEVDVAPITTHLHNSDGVLAQSIGGGGGNGAIGVKGDVETSGSKGFFATVGGSGGSGSGAATVSVTVSSAITTNAINSRGIAAQSIGGGGGDGGIGISGNVSAASENNDSGKLFGLALGGQGGAASNGGAVQVTLKEGASIQTLATDTTAHSASHGIYAQSIGGGGGNGGFGVGGDLTTNKEGGKAALITVGATGGTGGSGGQVTIASQGSISVAGGFSSGIFAQSIGGGGGSAGIAIDGQIESDKGHDIALGANGSGGNAKPGGNIVALVTGAISTSGNHGHAVLMQTIGGGGGTAFSSIKGGISLAESGSVAMILGGQSGAGGNGGAIDYNTGVSGTPVVGDITTAGTASMGIVAQSIGGGGGLAVAEYEGYAGGSSVTSYIQTNVGVVEGSQGQSDGGEVTLYNYANVTTGTNGQSDPRSVIQSHGIVAQSVGAGGGIGLTTGGITYSGGKPIFQFAGSANVEGNSAKVYLQNEGPVTTYGVDSHALVAQSIGGGGGIVGNLTRITFDNANPTYSAITSVGGGDSGNVSAAVGETQVINNAPLSTSGDGSYGILAQNISGGGGFATSLFGIEAALEDPTSYGVEAGDSGENVVQQVGGINTRTEGEQDGNAISGSLGISNAADITTSGNGASAIVAQSIGGGGGIALEGGWNAKNDAPFNTLTTYFFVGGNGVKGEDNNSMGASGNLVTVDHNSGVIKTSGFGSSGIYAQSIGGGGGRALTGATTTDGSAPVVGGLGGTEGDGGGVTIKVKSDITVGADDNSYPVTAFGVFAQSVGGGGGHGGVADFQGATAGTKLGASFLRQTSGDGGDVSVTSQGKITTVGNSSVGIFAQSVAGGGGVIGTATGSTAVSFGSNGGDGEAGTVTVEIQSGGVVSTSGQAAHGIIAQSASGNNHKGQPVTITLDSGSEVSASGAYAYGIWADSAGDNKGDITINNSGTISGGCLIENDGSTSTSCPSSATVAATTPTAAAVVSADAISPSPESAGIMITNAATALITNAGTITSFDGIDGDLMRSHADTLQVDNSGALIGSLHHFGTRATITNLASGTLYTGSTYDLGGTGVGRLINNGRVEVLGGTRTGNTAINGDLTQLSAGTLAFDLDPASRSFDGLTVSGAAALEGRLEYKLLTLGSSTDGPQTIELIRADGGVTLPSGALTATRSAVAGFETRYDTETVTLSYDVDFAGSRFANLLTVNERAVGFYLSILQDQGVMTDTLLKLLDIEFEAVYAETLSDLSAGAYADSHAVIALSNLALALSSARCDELGEVTLVSGQRQCSWLAVGGERLEVGDSRRSRGFDSDSFALLGGVDFELNDSVTRVGAAFQYTNHSMSIGRNTTNDGETFQALVRADRTVGDVVFGAHFGGGMGWFDVDRTVLGEIMTGDYSVPFLDIGGFASREFDMGGYYLEPRATLGLTHFFGTSTTETATGDIGLDVETDAQTVVYFRPSLQIGTERVLANGARLTAFGGVGVTGFLSGRNLNVSASFLGASSVAASFDTTSPLGTYLADLEAGVTLLSTEGWEIQGVGFGQFSDNVTAYGLRLQAAYRF